jgi:hypothetical protein
VPTSPAPRDNRERLALIQRLWQELKTARPGSPEYDALMGRMRQETDAFRAALEKDEPEKS